MAASKMTTAKKGMNQVLIQGNILDYGKVEINNLYFILIDWEKDNKTSIPCILSEKDFKKVKGIKKGDFIKIVGALAMETYKAGKTMQKELIVNTTFIDI
jgi:DNA polymerase III alpha subunit (gram-positive type)